MIATLEMTRPNVEAPRRTETPRTGSTAAGKCIYFVSDQQFQRMIVLPAGEAANPHRGIEGGYEVRSLAQPAGESAVPEIPIQNSTVNPANACSITPETAAQYQPACQMLSKWPKVLAYLDGSTRPHILEHQTEKAALKGLK